MSEAGNSYTNPSNYFSTNTMGTDLMKMSLKDSCLPFFFFFCISEWIVLLYHTDVFSLYLRYTWFGLAQNQANHNLYIHEYNKTCQEHARLILLHNINKEIRNYIIFRNAVLDIKIVCIVTFFQ